MNENRDIFVRRRRSRADDQTWNFVRLFTRHSLAVSQFVRRQMTRKRSYVRSLANLDIAAKIY